MVSRFLVILALATPVGLLAEWPSTTQASPVAVSLTRQDSLLALLPPALRARGRCRNRRPVR